MSMYYIINQQLKTLIQIMYTCIYIYIIHYTFYEYITYIYIYTLHFGGGYGAAGPGCTEGVHANAEWGRSVVLFLLVVLVVVVFVVVIIVFVVVVVDVVVRGPTIKQPPLSGGRKSSNGERTRLRPLLMRPTALCCGSRRKRGGRTRYRDPAFGEKDHEGDKGRKWGRGGE